MKKIDEIIKGNKYDVKMDVKMEVRQMWENLYFRRIHKVEKG